MIKYCQLSTICLLKDIKMRSFSLGLNASLHIKLEKEEYKPACQLDFCQLSTLQT